MTHSKRDRIAPISIFFLLYISRIVVSLTCIQHVTAGDMAMDVALSCIMAMIFNLVLSLPAILCCEKKKNPFDIKWIKWFYIVYFVFLTGVNISRFSYFASSVINPEASAWVFSLLIAVCVAYASQLGLEGISRFSAFAFILIITTIIVGLLFNLKNYEEINLYPIIGNDKKTIFENVLYMTSSSTEVPILLCLNKKVNKSPVKAYTLSVVCAFITTFFLLLFINATMGDAGRLNDFPVYTLFQMAKIGLFERLDAFLISLWIFGIFIKAVLLIYCASNKVDSNKTSVKCITFTVLGLIIAIFFTEYVSKGHSSIWMYLIPYSLSCVIIPLLTLIFKKRNLGDELLESF